MRAKICITVTKLHFYLLSLDRPIPLHTLPELFFGRLYNVGLSQRSCAIMLGDQL